MTATEPQLQASRGFVDAANRLPTLYCACGCERPVAARDSRGRPRRFLHGHNGHQRREQVGYSHYHKRVRDARGAPQRCEDCGTTDPGKRYEWASLSGNYADPNDYRRLCKACHNRFDDIARRAGLTKTGRPRLDMQGVKHRFAKLVETEVAEIRRRHAAGESAYALGQRFGVSDTNVTRIVRRRIWRHVP